MHEFLGQVAAGRRESSSYAREREALGDETRGIPGVPREGTNGDNFVQLFEHAPSWPGVVGRDLERLNHEVQWRWSLGVGALFVGAHGELTDAHEDRRSGLDTHLAKYCRSTSYGKAPR